MKVIRNENKPSNKLDQHSKKTDYADAKQAKGTFNESSSSDKESVGNQPANKLSQGPKKPDPPEIRQMKQALPDGFFDNEERSETVKLKQVQEPSKKLDSLESTKHIKGALPEGFFDNKDADLRARGIEVVKVNIK